MRAIPGIFVVLVGVLVLVLRQVFATGSGLARSILHRRQPTRAEESTDHVLVVVLGVGLVLLGIVLAVWALALGER